jgi:predicted enzyme related to lactoylglutathione lyase
VKIKHVAFTMYPVKNMARARKFYEKVLGLKKGKDFGGKWIEYYPGGTACFALTTMTGARPAANAGGSIAFEVADIDKAAARLAKAKAKVLYKLYQTPVCWFAAYRDSEGNAFMLHEKKRR